MLPLNFCLRFHKISISLPLPLSFGSIWYSIISWILLRILNSTIVNKKKTFLPHKSHIFQFECSIVLCVQEISLLHILCRFSLQMFVCECKSISVSREEQVRLSVLIWKANGFSPSPGDFWPISHIEALFYTKCTSKQICSKIAQRWWVNDKQQKIANLLAAISTHYQRHWIA